MSSLPPPQAPQPQAPVSPRRGRSQGMLIGGLAAAALVAGGVTYLATRGDDAATAPTTVPVVSTAPTTVPVTLPPTTVTEPPTTLETTIPETTPATVVIPDDATELGYGVYVPAIANVEVEGSDPYTFTNTDNDEILILQALNRDAGEDPNVLLQEYIDTFDADYTFIGYNPSVVGDGGHMGFPNIRLATVLYQIYQSDPEIENLIGIVYVVVRDDGLSIVGDGFGPPGESALGDEAYRTMVGSLSNAPSVGDTAEWFPAESALPSTVHGTAALPFASQRELALAPGYEVVDQSSSTIVASNGSDSLSVTRVAGVVTFDDALVAARDTLAQGRSVSSVADFAIDGEDQALPEQVARWSGADPDGTPTTGGVTMRFDATNQTALVVVIAHRTGQWDANAEGIMQSSVLWQLAEII